MAELPFAVAVNLAGSLVTIGHPFGPVAIEATALDLVKYCRGAILDGRTYSPEQQAQALVDEIRTTWDEWPEGGTKRLAELFKSKYAPNPKDPELPSYEELLSRRMLAPPCQLCEPGVSFCEYGGFRGHVKEKAIIDAFLKSKPQETTPAPSQKPKRPPITQADLDQIIAAGKASWEDEQRRKREQKAGFDSHGIN